MIAFLSLRQTFKCKVHLRAAYNSQFFFSTCVSLVVFCSNSGTNSAIFGGVSKSMLKQSRLNFDKIEKCE
ncbi:hypothetical protein EGU08_18035 [Acinetobacter baumannii]|nr:hypothetical protein EGU08_18035 [Acinetobacter baumannii]RSF54701.1 hypothetical protein EGU00_18260 [Acinetobacter baumannii]